MLRHHPSVLLAVLVAAFLVGLAAASAPFVRSAAASAALKTKLDEFTPFATGLHLRARTGARPGLSQARLVKDAAAREEAFRSLGRELGLAAPPVAAILTDPISASSPRGYTQLRLLARTGAPRHVRILSQVGGDGLLISHLAANALHVKAGDTIELTGAGLTPKTATVRVKGIYRALAYEPTTPYWTNYFRDIYPATLDSIPPPSFALTSPGELYRLVHALGRSGIDSVYELPADGRGLTLAGARRLDRRFAAVQQSLEARRTALAQRLCPPAFGFNGFNPGATTGCIAQSSLPAAIAVAEANVAAVSPAVTLLSGLGIGIALAVSAAAGVFAVRRRRVEAGLRFTRGERASAFAALTALEVLLPTLVGGVAGFALAYALTGVFAPRGTTDSATVGAGASHAALAVAAGLLVLTLTASFAFLRQYDTGVRHRPWLRFVPWELPLLVLAAVLLVQVERGGGLTTSGSSGAQHPTLAVFVFPLLLVAGLAGLAARLGRSLLRRGTRRAASLPVPVYLALRRLAAARGLLVVLVVVSAVSFGAFFYAETLAASLAQTTDEKAYTGNGSDVAGLVQDSVVLPRTFPYPLTKVSFGNGAGAVNSSIGPQVDVMVVDPKTLPAVLHWQRDWGPNPTGLLKRLASSQAPPLPVIVTEGVPPMRSLDLPGGRFPVTVLGRVHAFPGASTRPLVITSFAALDRAARAAHVIAPLEVTQTYVWAKGPPDEVAAAIASSRLDAIYVTTVDTFRRNPDVLLATRTYGYLRTIALAAGALALVGLLLYLQARQRAQAIASVLGRRMGLGRGAELLSLCLEVAGIVLFSAAAGAVVAIVAAQPIVRHIDPLPDYAPSPVFVVPRGTILVAAVVLALVSLAAAALTTWLARRTDVGEALRVA